MLVQIARIQAVRRCHPPTVHSTLCDHAHARGGAAGFTSSASIAWRSREERQQALHRRDEEPQLRKTSLGSNRYSNDTQGRRREETYTQEAPRRLRTNRRNDQQPLGVFDSPTSSRDTRAAPAAAASRKSRTSDSNIKPEDPKRKEVKDKVQMSLAAVKDLPPLTDQDFTDIYADLVSYDQAPSSPSQLRLSKSHADEQSLLPDGGRADGPVRDRIKELRARLESRLPGNSVESPQGRLERSSGDGGEGGVSDLLSQLRKMAQNPSAEYSDPAVLSIGGKTAQNLQLGGETAPLDDGLPSKPDPERSDSLNPEGDTSSTPDPEVSSSQTTESLIPSELDPALSPAASTPDNDSDAVKSHETKAVMLNEDISDRKAILKMLDLLLPSTSEARKKGSESTSQADIATSQEWAALVLEPAKEGDVQDLILTFDSIKRAGGEVKEDLLQAAVRTMPEMWAKGPARAQVLLRYLEEAQVSVSTTIHHEIISSILRRHLSRDNILHCERYLRTLEEASTPALPETYALVLLSIFKARNALPHPRQRAWNLFGHARLVAHPVPSVEMYNAMIYGCSLDDRVAPERALDLFVELVEQGLSPTYETYHSLIRSCARSSDDVFYFEALRLLRELLERNFKPERDIFNVLLEGARPRADLSRAKWIVGNMVSLAGRGAQALQPDDRTISNLFLTFATYKPTLSTLRQINSAKASPGKHIEQQDEKIQTQTVSEQSREIIQSTRESDGQQKEGQDSTGPLRVLEQTTMDLFSITIPGNNDQIVEQVTAIMAAIIKSQGLDPSILEQLETGETYSEDDQAQMAKLHDIRRKTSSAMSSQSDLSAETTEVLSRIPLTSHLLDSYLTVLCAHTAIWRPYSFFRNAYPGYNIYRNYRTWELMFDRLDKPGKQRVWRLEKARILFEEWKDWLQVLRNGKAHAEGRLNWWNTHIQVMWSRMIGIEAKAHTNKKKGGTVAESAPNYLDKSMQLLEDFVRRFPPEDIIHQARSQIDSAAAAAHGLERKSDSSTPGYLAEMSSFLYPETSDIDPGLSSSSSLKADEGKLPPAPSSSPVKTHAASDRHGTPPHMTFGSVYPLYHRFRELEDKRSEKVVKITGRYAAALREAEDIRARGEEGERRNVKEARKRLVLGQREARNESAPRLAPRRSERRSMPLEMEDQDRDQRGLRDL